MKKLITDKLIDDKLKERGVLHVSDMEVEEQLIKLQAEYDFEITDDFGNADIYFYTESTADNYEVYIASETDGAPYIGQDVYYYESDWFEKLGDYMRDGCTIHVDRYAIDEGPFTYAVEEAYQELYDTIQTEIIQKLKDEGYEY